MNEQLNFNFEEYPDLPTNFPDYNQLLTQRVSSIKQTNGFDPHKLMVQKKKMESGEIESNIPSKLWPEKDIKILEDFCETHGIIGYNCGKMNPIAALCMLKQTMGIVEGPLEKRVPYGYQQMNSVDNNVKKKTLLKG